ncbi:erythrocyte membrane protein 1, PfEMP1, putative [Plasmodium sp.]|nr:erythrocyte membrane protein 1, PfEMP1, putative [Plasmodium sp.]
MVKQVNPGGNVEDATAKNIFDRIGKEVHKTAKKNANEYRDKLRGDLSNARFEEAPDSQQTPSGSCGLDYRYHTNATNGKSYPCRAGREKRFSEVHGGECDEKKIRGSNSGACAPYRRLNLCVRNLENINRYDKINNDTLLAEVCLAALHEGASIAADHDQYKQTNGDSQICTMLARSFADIGDIIRGKDLYLGDNGKDKLENNLKTVFGKIYQELISKSGKNGDIKTRYEDKNGGNYYKLREDWWNANRRKVWRAITCGAPHDATYFIKKTCSNNTGDTYGYCRCIDFTVPTYFDYVPQYLRWFEEWAEDFCRLRKRKLEIAKDKCRKGEDGEEKYCDLNGYDCTKTAKGQNKRLYDSDCKKCSLPCDHFVHWIDNQKVEFNKQRSKYSEEIKKATQATNGTTNNLYVKDFYEKFETDYKNVKSFLEKLSKEKICEKHPEVGDGKRTSVNLNDEPDDIFSHTEYCQACPWCGVQGRNGQWKARNDRDCAHKNADNFNNRDTTDIKILFTDRGKPNIIEKLGDFCKNGKDIKKDHWKCHYDNNCEDESDESGDCNICVLQNGEIGTPKEKSMCYESFFWKWVTEMLIDSTYWRREIDNCIDKAKKGKCKNQKCNNDCKCYERWVKQKKIEWDEMIKHFKKQGGFEELGYDLSLKTLLNVDDILTNIKEGYEGVKEMKHLQEIIESEKRQEEAVDGDTENKTTIDKLIEHEQNEAKTCLQTQEDCNKPQQPTSDLGRSENPREDALPPANEDDVHDDDDIDDHDNLPKPKVQVDGHDNDVDHEDQVEETEVVEETVAEVTEVDGVKPCEIVAELFSDTTKFSDACNQKYGLPQRHWGWKCISDTTTGKSDASGSICVPPRRRRLYIQKLVEWAEKVGDTRSVPLDVGAHSSLTDATDLRDAFVKSAAVETFFLWHKYKGDKQKEKLEERLRSGDTFSLFGGSSSSVGTALPGAAAQAPLLPPQIPNGAGPPGLVPRGPGELGGPTFSSSLSTQSQLTGDPLAQPLPLQPLIGTLGDDNNPETLLQNGKIPPDFLRLMFYTLGDYRDILFSGDKDKKNGVNYIFSGDKEIAQREQKIKDAIQTFFQNGDSQPAPKKKNTPESWWEANGEHIWKGMICALTYTDSEEKGDRAKPTQDPTVRDKLWDDKTKKPKNAQYEYKKVKLDENSDTDGAKSTSPSPTSDTPLLTDFIKRPPYFRYLEEWGQNFCKERKRRLEDIKSNCLKDGTKQYSGDGEDCKTIREQKYDIFSDLEGPKCAKPCRFYKKWISTKKDEFDKQKNEFTKQKANFQNNNDNGFYKNLLETRTTAASFLEMLGSCKTNNEDRKDEINFKDEDKTFRHAKDCDPCSLIGVKCKNRSCVSSADGNTCKVNKITAEAIEEMNENVEQVEMFVIDNGEKEIVDDLKDCKSSGIFKGIRKDEWKCGEVCGVHICKSITSDGKKKEAEKDDGKKDNEKNVLIRVLFKRSLENFVEDYNKINAKISHCINNGEENKCKYNCQNKCKCVVQWINKKRAEWKIIRDRFLNQYESEDSDKYYPVKSFLQKLQSETELKKATGYKKLEDFEKSCHCNGDAILQDGEKRDVIDCLLDKLETKAKNCKDQPSSETQAPCEESSPEPDDEPLEEENENPVTQPNICPAQTPEPEVDEGGCTPDVKEEEEEKEEEKDKGDEEEEGGAAAPAAPPSTPAAPKPAKPKAVKPKQKIVKRSALPPILGASGFPWTVGIAFAALSYFILKKKTKASVGNLFQILQIPKSDYEMPTLKSSNRNIPYASDRYKGKTYIYMEGDSSGDEKYAFMSDTTDITSSESEYEELDINDIYAPSSPKYKTLIEVVLEPSKRDIQSGDTPMNKFTDEEWNQLKHDFISNMLQSQPNNVPNNYSSRDIPLNTQPNTLYFDNNQEKPFITSIHDRNLYSGEEYNYNVNMVNSMNDIPINRDNNPYSGIDLINDSLNSNNVDIYDELLKRKENELFGTNHPKHTNTHNVTKSSNSDPIDNQLDLFHTWLDRHRDMCEQWNNKEEVLDKLKEEWNKDNNSGGDIPSDSNKTLNTDVSIQIHMDNPKPINEFTNMDTILDDLDKYNEPYYDVQDDIYYDVHDDDASTVDSNYMDVPNKVQIEMDVNTKLVKEKYPISDVWDI